MSSSKRILPKDEEQEPAKESVNTNLGDSNNQLRLLLNKIDDIESELVKAEIRIRWTKRIRTLNSLTLGAFTSLVFYEWWGVEAARFISYTFMIIWISALVATKISKVFD